MQFFEMENLINKFYPEILDKPGEVFFGSKASLEYSNGVAIVGLNPGGNGLPKISENIFRYKNNLSNKNFSGYLDQCWHEPYFSNYQMCQKCTIARENFGVVHQDRHQKMVSKIADFVGFDLRKTIAMNAIWIQTKSAIELRKYLAENGSKNMQNLFKYRFFPIFKEIFEKCEIKLVICLGNGKSESSFEFFRGATEDSNEGIINVTDNYRDGKFFKARINNNKVFFFGVPHPSLHTTSEIGLKILKQKWLEISGK